MTIGALAAARANLAGLDQWARDRLVLENDDRVFTVRDVLAMAEDTKTPVVFDWHHHWCTSGRSSSTGLEGLLERCFDLWTDRPPAGSAADQVDDDHRGEDRPQGDGIVAVDLAQVGPEVLDGEDLTEVQG